MTTNAVGGGSPQGGSKGAQALWVLVRWCQVQAEENATRERVLVDAWAQPGMSLGHYYDCEAELPLVRDAEYAPTMRATTLAMLANKLASRTTE